MKKFTLLLIVIILVSCKKESAPAPSQPEDIEVMVYATPPGDTTIISSTPVIRMQVR